MTENIKQPWFLRKAAYVVASIVALVSVGLGLIDQNAVDETTNQVATVVSCFLLLFAAGKTHQGSDSTVTEEDVRQAGTDPDEVAAKVIEHLRGGFDPKGTEATIDAEASYAERIRGE